MVGHMFEQVVEWLQANRGLWPYIGGAIAVVALVVFVRFTRKPPRDPQRLFTAQQKRLGDARAGGRCEQVVWGLWRCRRPAQHGDHWVPWSKGGATSIGNYAALCAKCNLAKSDHMPSMLSTARLRHRRKRYFPEGEPT